MKLLSTTNSHFKYLEGTVEDGRLQTAFYFGELRTSYVISMHKQGAELMVKTRNSMYIFEVLDDSEINDFLLDGSEHERYEELVSSIPPNTFMVRD